MNLSLDELSTQGAKLLSNRDNPENACKNLNSWIELVGRHLASNYPDSGLLAEWLAIGNISHNSQYPLSFSWTPYSFNVSERLRWLSNIHTKAQTKGHAGYSTKTRVSNNFTQPFISTERIKELESLNSSKFELK